MLINRVRVLEEVVEKINRLENKTDGKLRLLLIRISDRLHHNIQIAKDMNLGASLIDVDLKQSVIDLIEDLALAIKYCKKYPKILLSLKWWQKELKSFVIGNKKKWKELNK